ncbi:DoxX family protein [Dyadobacter subterraneus]|uniref:DoxX family protein n=1 Tax=Dyadobacter subterraneus TaxID=2773304 RepID=A0ABR9WIN6_9BACT|nr:DoxX family protein [Dyadobacter subterraneus]MBE9464029.1 DoxX family protein [Dyadobacter subterraneus]
MKILINLFGRFDRLDTSINKWLVNNSILLLRISMGLVFLGFGILKFFIGVSPIESLATRTTTVLTLGVFAGHNAMIFVASLECVIGLCFLTGMFLRVGVWLLAVQMIGAMSPLLIYTGELFPGPMHAPTLAAQYIIKDIILIAAGMVIASTWTGAKIVARPQTMRSSLKKRIPNVYKNLKMVPD